jgi:hypothetical protein
LIVHDQQLGLQNGGGGDHALFNLSAYSLMQNCGSFCSQLLQLKVDLPAGCR